MTTDNDPRFTLVTAMLARATGDPDLGPHVVAGLAAAVFENNTAPLRALVREEQRLIAERVAEVTALELPTDGD